MSKFRCNSCGATYSDTQPDGMAFYHACPSETITHAVCDSAGNATTAEIRKPFPNRRDERPAPGCEYIDGKPVRYVPNPEERGKTFAVPAEASIVSEGAGRTQLE